MRRTVLTFLAAPLIVAGCTSASDGESSVSSSVDPTTSSATATTAPTAAGAGAVAEAQYLTLVRTSTPSLNDQGRIYQGYNVCLNLTEGKSLNESVIDLQIEYGVPREQAAIIAMSAPAYLCTEHKDRIRAEIDNLPG